MRSSILALVTFAVCFLAQSADARLVHRWSFEKDGSDSVGDVAAKLQDGAAVNDGKVALDGQSNWVEVPIGKTLEKLKSTRSKSG